MGRSFAVPPGPLLGPLQVLQELPVGLLPVGLLPVLQEPLVRVGLLPVLQELLVRVGLLPLRGCCKNRCCGCRRRRVRSRCGYRSRRHRWGGSDRCC